MLSREAIDNFLAVPINNSDKAKDFSEEAINEKLIALNPPPRFETAPRLCQKVSFLLSITHPGYLFFLDPGLGKTKLVLDIIRWRMDRGEVVNALVLVLNAVNLGTWKRQAKTHAPDMYVSLANTAQYDIGDITVMTYAKFLKDVSSKINGKPGRNIDHRKLDDFAAKFELLACDECTALGHHDSKVSVATRMMQLPFTYLLSGTPVGRDPTLLWHQFFVADRGEALGETLGMFRAIFCKEVKNYFTRFPDYVFDKKKTDLLYERMRHSSIRYAITECADLPERIPVRIDVPMSDAARKEYDAVLERARDRDSAAGVIENSFIKMRQLCSGYCTEGDADGERVTRVFDEQPKLEVLLEQLAEIPLDRKVLIFNVYIKSGEMICEALQKVKIKHLRLYSKTKQKHTIEERFDTDPTMRVLVCSEAGAFGMNVQSANYVFFYESPVSPIIREQQIRRAWRLGQKNTVVVTDLVTTGSVEEKVLGFIEEGRDYHQALLDRSVLL